MRPIDADYVLDALGIFSDSEHGDPHFLNGIETAREIVELAPTVCGWVSVEEAANIIAELFGDDCACNFNGIDEWLPQYCEHAATDCPHTAGTTCWEQYIKYLNKKPDIGRKEGERNGKL